MQTNLYTCNFKSWKTEH